MYKIVFSILLVFSLQTFAQICKEKRITPSNYPFRYGEIKRDLKKISGNDFVSKFNQLEFNHSEICLWNKFIFVDFFIYFDRFKDLRLNSKDNIIDILHLRDRLYTEWTQANKSAVYSDHSKRDLVGVELDDFLKMPSVNFRYMTKSLKILNTRPRKSGAKQFSYDLLGARSPFNSVFPKVAYSLLLEKETKNELQCLLNSNKKFNDSATDCFNSVDRMVTVLGVLASQRMYLIRDFASYAMQNLTAKDYDLFYDNASLSSQIYFKLETMAHLDGVETIYPDKLFEIKSYKPYHFYSVAYIAQELKKTGYSDSEIRNSANHYAKKYKKNIKFIGLLYNLISGIPIKNGAVGDKKQILKEQKLGVEYVLAL